MLLIELEHKASGSDVAFSQPSSCPEAWLLEGLLGNLCQQRREESLIGETS